MKKDAIKVRSSFLQTDDAYASVVASQKAHALEIADKLELGEKTDVQFAAAVLRSWANTLNTTRRKKAGLAAKIDYANVALVYEKNKRQTGKSAETLRGELAEKYEVDEDTIRRAVKASGKAAERHFDALNIPKHPSQGKKHR